MIQGLTIHLICFIALGYGIQWGFDAWVRKFHAPSRLTIWVGLVIVTLQLLWLALPLVNPLRPLELPMSAWLRTATYWWGWTLVICLALLILGGIARAWWAARHIKMYTTENPLALWGSESTVYFRAEVSRTKLEEEYRAFTGHKRLRIRFSEFLEVPVLTGFYRPTIILPIRLLIEPDDQYLEAVLDHQAEHVRLRHYLAYGPLLVVSRLIPMLPSLLATMTRVMIFRVDHLIFQRDGEFGWAGQQAAFRQIVGSSIGCSNLVGIPHHPREVEERFRRAKDSRRECGIRMIGLLGLMLFGGMLASASLGHVSIYAIKEFLVRHQISGYQTRIFDPNVRVQGLPGQGGVVGDGIVIDTTQALRPSEITSVEVDLDDLIPAKATAVAISFDYSVERSAFAESTPTFSTRTMNFEWNESLNLHQFWVFDFRWGFLNANAPKRQTFNAIVRSPMSQSNSPIVGSHKFDYSPYGAKDHGDLLQGPDIAIPPGWKVTLTNWGIKQIDPNKVEATKFPEDAKGFVAWYKALTWRTPINTNW